MSLFNLFANGFAYTAEDARENLRLAKEEDARRQAERDARQSHHIVKSGAEACFTSFRGSRSTPAEDSQLREGTPGSMIAGVRTPTPTRQFTAAENEIIRAAVLEERAKQLAEYRAQDAAERQTQAAGLALQIVQAADRFEGRAPRSYTFGTLAEAIPEPVYMTAEAAAQAIISAADKVDGAAAPAPANPEAMTADSADALAALIVASADRAEGRTA